LRRAIGTAGVLELVTSYTQLGARASVVLGVHTEQLGQAREILREEIVARVRAMLPKLPDDEARAVKLEDAITHASNGEPRNLALEQAIDNHPDDPAAYSVLADWLAERDHPR